LYRFFAILTAFILGYLVHEWMYSIDTLYAPFLVFPTVHAFVRLGDPQSDVMEIDRLCCILYTNNLYGNYNMKVRHFIAFPDWRGAHCLTRDLTHI
jgi:hypothetical protein